MLPARSPFSAPTRFLWWLQALCLVAIPWQTAFGDDLSRQRADFLAAENAYAKGRMDRYAALKADLTDYPLFPYLEYRELGEHLTPSERDRISAFLKRHEDTPLAPRLRARWLSKLAHDKRWHDYIDFYDLEDDDTKRRCHYLTALIRTGRGKDAYPLVPEVWRYGKSQPPACDPVFKAWREAGYLTPDRAWERITLAMEAGQLSLAGYLRRYLPPADRKWVDAWVDIYRDPKKLAGHRLLKKDHAERRTIVAHGVKRLARYDPAAAVDLWNGYRKSLGFTEAEACPVDERLAIILEDDKNATSLRFFRELEPCRESDRLQEARIRGGLLHGDWEAVLTSIEQLPPESAGDDRWRYWKARALETTGRDEEARGIYTAVAGERSYYGFLAADRAGGSYRYDHTPLELPAQTVTATGRLPAMQRMRELYHFGRLPAARREWLSWVNNADTDTLMAAALLFERWGWLDRAIFTVSRANHWDDLAIRFPLRHKDEVMRYARLRNLDHGWVYGVLRQESAFMQDARSSAGALGLMQLMPRTAKQVARELGQPRPSARALLEPETNITLGTAYLRMMLDDFGGHRVLATAAYNAGPHRVRRWLPEEVLPADIWVELIPFRETRRYVQRVMAYAVLYDQRMGEKPVRLSQRMPSVRPTALAERVGTTGSG
ncbi:MAG: transglycosylase SLT domain-containing protein [Pseudomonadota bacterium]